MRYDLRQLARRASNPRRRAITLRDIVPPATLATDLYQAGYAPVITLWRAATERIIAEYARTLSAMTTDSPADVQNEVDAAASEMQRLVLTLTPQMRRWTIRVESWLRGKWRGAVLAATGVDLETMLGPEDVRETLETVLARNVALVKDVSAQAQGRISDAVFRGLTTRSPARDVAKEIRQAVEMGRARSIRIASDQATKLTSTLASERRREAGLTKWAWVSSHKANPRPEHATRDGKVYDDKTAPADLPGQLPYCGCRERAVLDFD